MTWTVTQTNNSVTGPVLVQLPNGVVLLNGALSGNLSGSVLTYTIAVSAGGIPTYPSCTGKLGGTVTASTGATSTMAGVVRPRVGHVPDAVLERQFHPDTTVRADGRRRETGGPPEGGHGQAIPRGRRGI